MASPDRLFMKVHVYTYTYMYILNNLDHISLFDYSPREGRNTIFKRDVVSIHHAEENIARV